MGVPCRDCGFQNPREAISCGGCGRSLGAPRRLGAERRQITVFFADLVGSTSIAEELDPEDLRDLYGLYQSVCADVIERCEGHLAQYLGDGVLAYFGYPAAHEDDASRAVRAALEILKRSGAIEVAGRTPQVRVGIHTGLVVIGDVGAGARQEQLALGETPNIAARLQSEALPDTIVISDATRKLLAGQFELEGLGARALKGLSRPVEIFRVIGGSRAATRFEAMKAARGLTPFVGRASELESIRAAWSEAAAGRGRALLLRGEAGMGKSRLLEAAGQLAANAPHELFRAQCSPYQLNSPLNPMVEMLERRIGIAQEMGPADKLDRIEDFASRNGRKDDEAAAALAGLFAFPTLERYPGVNIPPAKRRAWMIGVLTDLLLRSATGAPVLYLIEDLHWADPSTLDLLGEIVAHMANRPILLVCTGRPETAAPWLSDANCQILPVEALPKANTRELVARVAGSKSLPLTVVEELVVRTGGTPLFVEAVTRTVLEAGVLRESEHGYELVGPLPPGLIPATVQDSLMARIDRLGSDRPVAQVAAAIGRESSFELLQAVLDMPPEELTRAVRHLVNLELVFESGSPPDSTYTFRHALIQDAAYESLLRKTRQEFHGKIAEVLVHRFPDMAETRPELLARHFEGAGRTREAIAGWMRAGQRAGQSMAFRESVAHWRRAISLLDTLPDDDPDRLRTEMEAQLAIAQVLMTTVGWGSREAGEACIRARDLCRALGNIAGLIQSLTALSTVYFVRGVLDKALEASHSVLEMALTTNDVLFQAGARVPYAYTAYFMADFALAREEADRVLAVYTPENERLITSRFQVPATFAAANARVMSLWFMGYTAEAEESRRQAWTIIESLNVPACTAYGYGHALLYHYARRDRRAIAELAQRLYPLCTEEGYLVWGAQSRIYLGWLRALEGDAEQGMAEMNAGLESYRLTGSGLMTVQFCLMRGEALWVAGRPQEATAALAEGLAHAAEYHEHAHEPELHRLMGEILLAEGETAEGEACLRRAIDLSKAQIARTPELRAALALARWLAAHDRNDEARDLLIPVESWFLAGRELIPELREARQLLDSLPYQTARPV
ncbi:MAG TPA: adenylate/guanylate cyclase domain-containing protein [Bryobacteraceae bacterium]|nr:adenylate/guanylate cyclase domain-containing protein [Bryobacteraceae bacterium]